MPFTRVRSSRDDLIRISGETIEILVGEGRQAFSVHENIIRASSPFFEKALAGEWTESSSRTVEMPNDEPEIFAIYIHWLYCGKLSVRNNQPRFDKLPFDKETVHSEYMRMVKAYVLGDKILDTKFQDTCIDGIIESTDKPEIPPEFRFHPTGEAIEYVYNNTCESAPIGKLFVNMYAIQGTRMWLSGWKDSSRIPRQFLLDLSFTLMSRRGKAHSYHVALRPWEYHTGETSDDDLVSEDESLCSECAAKFEIE